MTRLLCGALPVVQPTRDGTSTAGSFVAQGLVFKEGYIEW
jgi:hypothetical protein